MSNDNGVQGFAAYDGSGRRVESREGNATTFYAYGGTETLSERVSGGAETNYVYTDGYRIAIVTGKSAVNYFRTDALGSTRLVTDNSNHPNVLFSDNYQPYGQDNGNPTCPTCPTSPQLEFTGKASQA